MTLARDLDPACRPGKGMRERLRAAAAFSCLTTASRRIPTLIRTDAGYALQLDRARHRARRRRAGRPGQGRSLRGAARRHRDAEEDRQPAQARGDARVGVRPEPRMARPAEPGRQQAPPEVTVAQLRGWIEEEQPGLPEQRAEPRHRLLRDPGRQGVAARRAADRRPKLDKITDDMVLRSQELPTEEEFETASARAAGHLPHPATAGAQPPLGARAGRRHPPQRDQPTASGQNLAGRAGRHASDARPGR